MPGRIGIVGAGGMGSAFAAHLARAGHPVVLVGRGSGHVRALVDRPLTVCPPDGDPWTVRIPVAVHAADLGVGSLDLAILLTKAFDAPTAAADIASALAPHAVAVGLQNGLGLDDVLAGALGGHRALVGVTTVGATLQEPGRISVSASTAANRSSTQIGETGAARGGHRLPDLVRALSDAGLPTTAPADVAVAVWDKLALAVMSPISAILRMTVGQVWASPSGRALVERMFDEVVAVGTARGVPLDRATAWAHARDVFLGTGEHHTSMCTDVMQGRRTELDTMADAVRRLAVAEAVPVPVHDTVVPMLRTLGA